MSAVKKIVISKDNIGCIVSLTPSAPSTTLRTLRKGEASECLYVMEFNKVPYARVLSSGWIRVNESDGHTPHVEVVDLPEEDNGLIVALLAIADAIRGLNK
jgi:hypothetical protein